MLLSIPGTPSAFRVLQSIQYGTVPGLPPWKERLYLDLLIPDPPPRDPTPAVVYFHGGGWAEGACGYAMYPWLNPLLAAHGFVTASVTYRLSRFAPFPAQIHDAKAAIRWLRANAAEYGIDPSRIGVWGDSAGGHLAELLGTSAGIPQLEGPCGSPGYPSNVQAVVARCAPTDFVRWRAEDEDEPGSVFWRLFGGPGSQRRELARLASPITHVAAGVPPFLLVHGTEDETVPYEQATLLAGALRAHGGDVTIRTVAAGHHNLTADVDAQWGNEPWTELGHEALAFFTERLGAPTRAYR